MSIIPINDEWTYRRPSGPFAAFDGGPEVLGTARLPHDALRDEERTPDAPARGAGAYYPSAAYTYTRTLDVPEAWEGRTVQLEVQGAYRRAQVFLNDELAGVRADGYTRFFVDLTPFLRYGTANDLRIEVRSGEDSRWYSGAGLHRPVILHVDEPVRIVADGVRIVTERIEDDQAVVSVVTSVVNETRATRTVRVHTGVADASGIPVEQESTPLTLAPGEQADARQVLYIADPALWGPDSPALYTAAVALDDEEPVLTSFGIRTVTVDPRKGLRINGEEVLMRGACIHHDNGPLGGAAIGRAEERRIELLKEAGFNAIRAAHNPLSPAMLDACDRLGMLVMDEAFDMWTRFKTPYDYAADFPTWWEADLEALVAKDRNHPSVIMYSIGNEIVEVGTPHGARWARRLADKVRALDPTRPVTNGVNALLAVIDEMPRIVEELGGLNALMADKNAMATVGATDTATARIEESSAAVDVLGLNYAEKRYAQDRQAFPHRVLVGSETFGPEIGRLWPMVKDSPNVIGDFTWTGWDYLGEVGIGSTMYQGDDKASGKLEREFPYLTAWCADIDLTGHRRPLSYYREIVFGLRTEPYIAVRRPEFHGVEILNPSMWAWSDSVSSWTWHGYEGRPATVEVYADADEVALELDGTEIARAAVGTDKPMLAVLETTYRPGTLVAIAYRDGAETGRTSLATAGEALLTASADATRLVDDDDALSYVAIELRDAAGALVTDADREVTVEVTGAAVLAGMCSANPSTVEHFDASTWRTFDGRALAVVRPAGTGAATVTVTAEGFAPVVIDLTVVDAGCDDVPLTVQGLEPVDLALEAASRA
ncbi:glycoside hydrolase family 2 TIM barrel-domain containing protein [Demequina sp. SYSU T00192]|uniref:Glycoside hydrolase family 2 TIM barrel-domain containing protein n=1 Tax=Demequina litoralis TaxID=3051660 RepID=A0ABT8G5P0_9MICO|nr:glycoside hydrolase family 2 TIM barrel-domain containing protein [Demequina sp. SYSU T00192]MDN4474449.1 glycoside hydrolase family 2 TIM barrel-domain containing protein [Demequina sp. SYSU T00192]